MYFCTEVAPPTGIPTYFLWASPPFIVVWLLFLELCYRPGGWCCTGGGGFSPM